MVRPDFGIVLTRTSMRESAIEFADRRPKTPELPCSLWWAHRLYSPGHHIDAVRQRCGSEGFERGRRAPAETKGSLHLPVRIRTIRKSSVRVDKLKRWHTWSTELLAGLSRTDARWRADERWVADLNSSGQPKELALADLRAVLVACLTHAFRANDIIPVEDAVQDALLRIVDRIETYRGDSHFVSWAMAIATRTLLSQLRRAHWSDVSLDEMLAAGIVRPLSTAAPDMEGLDRKRLWEVVQQAIDRDLTERQRHALQAEMAGVPPEVFAERTGSNRNAVYKLLHDARVRLRQAILAAGWTEQSIRSLLENFTTNA